MEENLINIKNDAVSLIIDAKNLDDLNSIKLDFLGKSGKLTEEIKNIGKIEPEKRPEIGRLANEIKETLEDLINDKLEKFAKSQRDKNKFRKTDVTLPGKRPPLGHLHLVTQGIEEISTIFEKIGFVRRRYPEIEWDYYAFTALNFPDNHPARDEWETFFIKQNPDPEKGDVLLTPHTSSGQIREMKRILKRHAEFISASHSNKQIPKQVRDDISIRMLNITKCYRRQSDVSHTPMFHQFEGLVIDKNISIAHLKGTLNYFVKSYFGKHRKSRIRPYHFQFTEPSFEVDVTCGVCNGKGCKLCKEGWLELGGSGMVHPNVLKNGGINSKDYTGFAFGWGVERALMMKEGLEIDDLRILYSNNLEFLEQF